VLPEGCALPNHGLSRPPLPAGEGLCFAEGAPPCDHSKLSVRAGRTGLAAGSVYQPFEVVNRSGRTCTVTGVPHLVAVDRHGRAIGPPATTEPDLSTMTGDHPKVMSSNRAASPPSRCATARRPTTRPPCGERWSTALRVTIPPGPPTSVPYRMERCPDGVQGLGVGRVD
jgi:Protein of unknown function (DUF4232)